MRKYDGALSKKTMAALLLLMDANVRVWRKRVFGDDTNLLN